MLAMPVTEKMLALLLEAVNSSTSLLFGFVHQPRWISTSLNNNCQKDIDLNDI